MVLQLHWAGPGADLEVRDKRGGRPLYLTVLENEDLVVVKVLLDA